MSDRLRANNCREGRDAKSANNCHRLGECELALCHRPGDICFFLNHDRRATILRDVFYGAVLSALLFAAAFIFWNYYPHGLPPPTLMTAQQQVQVTQANPTPSSRVQAKSPIYVVIAIQKITDPEAYKPLPEKGRAAAEAAGGHYLIRTGNITRLDGVTPERLALIEFDSIEKAQAWYRSPAQKDADAIRSKSTDSLAFIVEGLGQ
jgi:uncharacterized protein (DUF1330 family)